MTTKGQSEGPFGQAEEAVRVALATADATDWPLRVTLTVAMGAATAMRATMSDDAALRHLARQAITEAEQMLPDARPTDDWYDTARILLTWSTVQALYGQVADLDHRPKKPVSWHAVDSTRLPPHSAATLQTASHGSRSRWPADRSRPALLRAASADLHAAMVGLLADSDLRRRIDETLGICAAELYWADPEERTEHTMREAVVHLNRALAAGEHGLPTVERADLLGILARCYREVARRNGGQRARDEAERAARAAVRELARCVLIAENTDRALQAAARANEIVARAVGWCLADGRHQAAAEMAEAGRGLVLAGVVLTGRVDEMLRNVGKHDVADAWRGGGEAGRVAALNALWDADRSGRLLAAPATDEISVTLVRTRFDAVV